MTTFLSIQSLLQNILAHDMQALDLKSMTQGPLGSTPPPPKQGTQCAPTTTAPSSVQYFLNCLDEDREAVLPSFENDKARSRRKLREVKWSRLRTTL